MGRIARWGHTLALAMALTSCSSEKTEPTWRPLATTLAFPSAPQITFTPEGELLLVFEDGSLKTINPDGNPNDPSAFLPFQPAAPPGTGGPLRAETSTLWLIEGNATDASTKVNYRLDRGARAWVRVDGDPNATRMTRIWEVSGGTLYAICLYPQELPQHGTRVCFKKGDGPWQSGDSFPNIDPANLTFYDGTTVFDDHHGGLLIGGELGVARIVDGLVTTYSPVFTHTPKVTPATVGLAGVTRDGNFLFGVWNYGGAEPWVYEIRADGLGRSWVDQGCVRIEPYSGTECTSGRFDQVWASELPQLSPSGAAYQIWRVQNGAPSGVLMRARSNGTKWEVLGDGNPFQDQNPRLFISPTTGQLFNFATGLSVSGGGTNGYLGVGNAGLYTMSEPELP